MPDQDELIIVGSDGTEHVFPAAMDPKKAAQIVRTREHATEGGITSTLHAATGAHGWSSNPLAAWGQGAAGAAPAAYQFVKSVVGGIPGFVKDVVSDQSMEKTGAQLRGLAQGVGEQLKLEPAQPGLLRPRMPQFVTGFMRHPETLVSTQFEEGMPTSAKIGRAMGDAALMYGTGAILKGAKGVLAGRGERAAQAAKEIRDVAAGLAGGPTDLEVAYGMGSGTPAIRTPPPGSRLVRPSEPKLPAPEKVELPPDTGQPQVRYNPEEVRAAQARVREAERQAKREARATAPRKAGNTISTRPATSLPASPATAPAPASTVERATRDVRNGLHRAEAEAEALAAGRTEPPGRPPAYAGPERRGPSRVSSPEEDARYAQMREAVERKNAEARAQQPGPRLQPQLTGTTAADWVRYAGARRRAPVATTQLQDFIQERYAGRTVSRQRLARDLREEFGSERAARMLGTTRDEIRQLAPGPSRIPNRGLRAIESAEGKQAVESMQATEGAVTPPTEPASPLSSTAAPSSMMKGEAGKVFGNERGAAPLKTLLPLTGAIGGATLLPLAADERSTENQRLGQRVVGGLGGLALGLSAANPRGAAEFLLRARINSMLSGMAIPKNLANYAGAAGTAAVENLGTSRGALAKELLRLPTNARVFQGALRRGSSVAPYVSQASGVSAAKPPLAAKIIGAMDETATQAARRAGISDVPKYDPYIKAKRSDVQRLLLSAPNSLENIVGPGRSIGPARENIAGAGHIFFPFQRVPANVVREGFGEVNRLLDRRIPVTQKALTAGSFTAGDLLGQWVAEKNPKKRALLASTLLAVMGPRTLLGTMGGMWGAKGYGRSMLGGASPVPEFAFDPKTVAGVTPSGVKVFQRLFQNQ